MDIEKLINPETPLERRLLADPELIEGLSYGKPRKGHPEGQVAYHVKEVLGNVDEFSPAGKRNDLRFIAITHDSFKHKVDRSQHATGENHHAMIARRFAEKYTSLESVLDVIELHDEAYNSWGIGDRGGKWDKAKERAYRLIKRLGDNIDLYMYFYACDNNTGDKSPKPYNWFVEIVNEYNENLHNKENT